MATSSFEKDFVVTDPEAIHKLYEALDNPQPVTFTPIDLEEERAKGLALLAEAFSD